MVFSPRPLPPSGCVSASLLLWLLVALFGSGDSSPLSATERTPSERCAVPWFFRQDISSHFHSTVNPHSCLYRGRALQPVFDAVQVQWLLHRARLGQFLAAWTRRVFIRVQTMLICLEAEVVAGS